MFDYTYNFTCVFLHIMCNKNVLIILGKIYQKMILNLDHGVAIFRTFLQNELVT
jgi:hypothetical protein